MAEHEVGVASTLLQEGEMKRIELEDKPIVLARVEGEYYAFGGKCTHYGAPLQEGALRGHSLICPWHHACFDIRSGARLEPPALNDLPRYPVQIRDGRVLVVLPNDNVTAPQGKADPADQRTFVIVGGGAAGGAAAEELRRARFAGRIVMISAVPNVPVDRPNLSKDYLDGHAKAEWIPLRGQDWYAARDIELLLNTHVTAVDPVSHTVHLSNGDSLQYDKLLLATGGTPRHLNKVPGADLQGIYTLRTLADADQIIEAVAQGKRVAIIGASFIGMEVAAALAGGREANVTVIGLEDVPFAPILGEEIGRMFQREHEANGVQFRLNDTVTQFIGENGTVRRVELKSGQVLDVDFVIVGIGVIPVTDFLQNSGIELDQKDHSVHVNERLQASQPDIYAAGDIARWQHGASSTRIEHWRVAQQHGLVAARNMLGESQSVTDRVPFFWTTQWGLTLNYVGHAQQWDEIIYRGGSPEDKKFIAFYVHQGELKAAVGCGYDTELAALEWIIQQRLPLSPNQMRDEAFDLIAHAQHHDLRKPTH